MTVVSSLADRDFAASRPAGRTFHDIYFAALLLAVAGYAVLGKGFAYAGVPPIFAGEVVLGIGLVTLLLPSPSWAIFARAPSLLLVLLMAWTLIRTIPYIADYKADALRDSVIVMYGLFAFVVANLILERPSRIDDAMRWAARFFTFYGAVAVFLYVLPKYLGAIIPHWPGSDAPLIALRGGEVSVQVGGAAVFALLGLKRSSLAWVCMLLVATIAVSAQSRGGMLAIVVPAIIATVLSGRFKPLFFLTFAILPIVSLLYVADVEIPMQSDQRSVKVSQLIDNAASIFVRMETSDHTLDDTKLWRLHWWERIADYTLHGRYFWTGKGFGISLAESDGFLGTDKSGPPLRSPHSAHMTILARSGLPGLVLWVSIGMAWLGSLVRSIFLAWTRGDEDWARLLIFVMCDWIGVVIDSSFDVALEGPMVGVLFWVLFGAGVALVMTYDALCRDRLADHRRAGAQ